MAEVCRVPDPVVYRSRFVVAVRADGEADAIALDGVDADGHIYTVETFDEGRVRVELRGSALPDSERAWQLRHAAHALLEEADRQERADRESRLSIRRGEFL